MPLWTQQGEATGAIQESGIGMTEWNRPEEAVGGVETTSVRTQGLISQSCWFLSSCTALSEVLVPVPNEGARLSCGC